MSLSPQKGIDSDDIPVTDLEALSGTEKIVIVDDEEFDELDEGDEEDDFFDFDETLIDKGKNFIIAREPNTGKKVKISSGNWPIEGPKFAEQGYTFDFSDFVKASSCSIFFTI